MMILLVVNGCVRLFVASKQAGIITKLLLVFFWWMPVLNLVLLKKICNLAIKEYEFVTRKAELNNSRVAAEVCRTKYPLLLVHGIFWRDWQAFNYWGRIPKELEANGAICFYGSNKSSASVAESGAELADCIQKIVSETGCEKLNIIAHSKGGLDSRFAISGMGMGKYVASLTAISTPHYGCNSVQKLVDMIPEKLLHIVNKKYETLYSILGDNDPDFLNGLIGLTERECRALNMALPDDPMVYYQSVCSKMTSRKGAVFPLNVGYTMIKWNEGENDGLVAVDSMIWGNFLGVITPRGKQGISHGDMIDLTRKNIEGFDVCEFYVDLVSKLKERGM
jgi:triacylglycerol lipase